MPNGPKQIDADTVSALIQTAHLHGFINGRNATAEFVRDGLDTILQDKASVERWFKVRELSSLDDYAKRLQKKKENPK